LNPDSIVDSTLACLRDLRDRAASRIDHGTRSRKRRRQDATAQQDCAAIPNPHMVQLTTSGTPMDQPIPAAEANRQFSRLLHEVRDGRSCVVTAHGKPVARIVPCTAADAARAALLQRLAAQPAIDIGPWTRDALYER
jgi:prevent-host-death family protein